MKNKSVIPFDILFFINSIFMDNLLNSKYNYKDNVG